MTRQDGRTTVHYNPGDGFPMCGQQGSVLMTTDPDVEGEDVTMCGRCMRQLRRRSVMGDAVTPVVKERTFTKAEADVILEQLNNGPALAHEIAASHECRPSDVYRLWDERNRAR